MNEDPEISIIITGLNVEKTIEKTLSSLENQDIDIPYEIIYVDAGSMDRTIEIIRKKFPKVKLIVSANATPAEGRNIGVKHSSGGYIAFIDADCIANKNWLKKLVTAYHQLNNRFKIGAVGATLIEDPDSSIKNKIIYRTLQTRIVSGGTPQFSKFKEYKEVKSLPAGNFLCSKEVFCKAGGFSGDLWYCEDADFHTRLIKKGYKLFYVPGAEVIHLRSYNSFTDLAKHMFKYGVGRGYSIKKIKHLRSPIYYMLIMTFVYLLTISSIFLANLIISLLGFNTILQLFTDNILLKMAYSLTFCGVFLYVVLIFLNSLKLTIQEKNIAYLMYAPLITIIVHIFYTVGLIRGLLKREW